MLKKLLIVVGAIIALPFVIALFSAKSYEVEREVIINQPKDKLFSYLKQLKNQDEFSTWAKIDPNMTKTFKGVDGTVGFISAWSSQHEDVGSGEQEIMGIKEGARIEFELRFLEPFESISPAYMTTETVAAGQTKVKWGFKGNMDYPLNLMLLLMDFEQVIGDDLQSGLDNLKVLQEM
jgi:hypothetical protein